MVKYKIAAVVAEFNYDITQMMLELATAEAKNTLDITSLMVKTNTSLGGYTDGENTVVVQYKVKNGKNSTTLFLVFPRQDVA